jgi:hypothetical protein
MYRLLFVHLVPRLVLLSLLAVLAFDAPAVADLVTWNLAGVTLADGGGVQGSFVYNSSLGLVTSWDIRAACPDLDPEWFYPAPNGWPMGWQQSLGGWKFGFLQDWGNFGFHDLVFEVPTRDALASPGVLPAQGVYEGTVYNSLSGAFPWGGSFSITSGELSAVPLPPTALLLGSCLLGLAGLRRFRKG